MKRSKRQRLKRDPMNQRRQRAKAWAQKHGAIVETETWTWPGKLVTHRLRLVGWVKDKFHPNRRRRWDKTMDSRR